MITLLRSNNILPILLLASLFPSCKKETIHDPYDVFSKEYTTGIIKFSYSVPDRSAGLNAIKDTTVQFISIGDNISEKDDYGYSKPSTPWVQLHRLNPNDFQNRTFIFFVGTNLDSLLLPYTFRRDEIRSAQINYVIGLRPFIDSNGNTIAGTNTFAAGTNSNDFTLTVLSNNNNRLQGTYSGTVSNQDGHILKIRNGLFDVRIVNK